MKKLLATILVAVALATTLTTTATQPRLVGDVNNNGAIDIGDALEGLKYLAGMNSMISENADFQTMMSARINNPIPNGVIEIGDTLEILKNLAGMNSALTSSPVLPAISEMESLIISVVNPTENGGWLEISNPTAYAATTKGLYLSNDDDDLFLWQMPAVIIRPDVTVRIRANSNSTCDVLKRMQTNFDIADGDTVRLSDAHGNVLSEVGSGNGSDEPRLVSEIIFRTGDMVQLDSTLWVYVPPETIRFTIPTDQNIFNVEGYCLQLGQSLFDPGRTITISSEGRGIAVFFWDPPPIVNEPTILVFA
jgi:hypothetical protein